MYFAPTSCSRISCYCSLNFLLSLLFVLVWQNRTPTTLNNQGPTAHSLRNHHYGWPERSQIRHLLYELGHLRPRPPALLPHPQSPKPNSYPVRLRQRPPRDRRSLPDRPLV